MHHNVYRGVLAAFAAMSVASALLPAFAQEQTALERRGESLLATHCSRCHATGRTGASLHSDAPPFRTLSNRYPVAELGEALAEGLSVGHPDMPEFVFDPDEVAAIFAYLKSIQERYCKSFGPRVRRASAVSFLQQVALFLQQPKKRTDLLLNVAKSQQGGGAIHEPFDLRRASRFDFRTDFASDLRASGAVASRRNRGRCP